MADSGSHNESCASADSGTPCHCDCKGGRHGEGMTVFRSRAVADRAKDVATSERSRENDPGKEKLSTATERAGALRKYKGLNATEFWAKPEAERTAILDELRTIATSGDTTTRAVRGSYGTLIRGPRDMDHVSEARAMYSNLSRPIPKPVDTSVDGRAGRLKAARQYHEAAEAIRGVTLPELQQIASAAGFDFAWGWTKRKLEDRLIRQATSRR